MQDNVYKNVCVFVRVFQVGIVSYGETVSHRVNLSQFANTEDLLKFVRDLPQQTGSKTMTFLGIDTARYSTLTPPAHMDHYVIVVWQGLIGY